jgi:hypothetical protein
MKSKLNADYQFILSDASQSATVGFIQLYRELATNYIVHMYANGAIASTSFAASTFFQNLDNQ